MKPTQPGALSRSHPIASRQAITDSHASAAHQPFIQLNSETIPDWMIRELREDAQNDDDAELAVICSKALRPITALKIPADAAQRIEARRQCADEVNDRASEWLRLGHATDAKYAEYVRLMRSPPDLADTKTNKAALVRSRASKSGELKAPNHPLCWSCQGWLDAGDDHAVVKTHSGPVTVHNECVQGLVTHGFVDHQDVEEQQEAEDTLDLDEDDL